MSLKQQIIEAQMVNQQRKTDEFTDELVTLLEKYDIPKDSHIDGQVLSKGIWHYIVGQSEFKKLIHEVALAQAKENIEKQMAAAKEAKS